nr:immunoglobulin light chain junction region [Macaca mulatta]MOW12232.1 immunoglobulin light chain junction region [Macaca mulatta]MOX24546.1 immunoglobulin light chain junction region [Macaca mulatta]MOX24838.1 immunoglobulin light chain junction region [Macaca mulatta]MOX25396.1 immunoglobulin light chain junction region [Macaca mulatta]
CQQYNNSPPTF